MTRLQNSLAIRQVPKKSDINIELGSLNANLEGSASKIACALNLRPFEFKDQHQANQGYDFWRETEADGVRYQIRGDSWYPNEIQSHIVVTLSGKNLSGCTEALRAAAIQHNWRFRLSFGSC